MEGDFNNSAESILWIVFIVSESVLSLWFALGCTTQLDSAYITLNKKHYSSAECNEEDNLEN